MCQLFKSCFFNTFKSGKVGELHCSSACQNFVNFFPSGVCTTDNPNQIDAAKWTVDRTAKTVCWQRTKKSAPACVSVKSFSDINKDDPVVPVDTAPTNLPSVPVKDDDPVVPVDNAPTNLSSGPVKDGSVRFGPDPYKVIQCLTDKCFNEFLTEECAKCKHTCHYDNVTQDEEGNLTLFFQDVRKCMRDAGCIMTSKIKKEDCEVVGDERRKLEFQKCRQDCYDQKQPSFNIFVSDGCDVPRDPLCTDFSQISYHVIDQSLNWEDANQYCKDNYAHGSLATMHSEEEWAAFDSAINGSGDYLFIGARRAKDDTNRWMWIWDDEDQPDTSGSEICPNHSRWWFASAVCKNLYSCVYFGASGLDCAIIMHRAYNNNFTYNRTDGKRPMWGRQCSSKEKFVCSSRC